MEKTYVSVKEFADMAGVSTQAVYKQENNWLQPYMKQQNGRKMVDTSALILYETSLKPMQQQLFNQLQTEIETKDVMIQCLRDELSRCQRLMNEERKRFQQLLTVNYHDVRQVRKKRWWQFWK